MAISCGFHSFLLSILLCATCVLALPGPLAGGVQVPLPTDAPVHDKTILGRSPLLPRQASGQSDTPILGGVPSGLRAQLVPQSSEGCQPTTACAIRYPVSFHSKHMIYMF